MHLLCTKRHPQGTEILKRPLHQAVGRAPNLPAGAECDSCRGVTPAAPGPSRAAVLAAPSLVNPPGLPNAVGDTRGDLGHFWAPDAGSAFPPLPRPQSGGEEGTRASLCQARVDGRGGPIERGALLAQHASREQGGRTVQRARACPLRPQPGSRARPAELLGKTPNHHSKILLFLL